MHPDPRFRTDTDPLDLAHRIGFAQIFLAGPVPMVAHAPVTRHGDALRFHISRANRLAAQLDGATVLISVAGPEGYISPNWYANAADQVPTWNYVAVEVDGACTAIDESALIDQLDALDALAAQHEPRVNPANPWTRAKMDEARFAKMLRGIRGFEVAPSAIRTTMKLSQNKPAADRIGAAAGLRAIGCDDLADMTAGM